MVLPALAVIEEEPHTPALQMQCEVHCCNEIAQVEPGHASKQGLGYLT